MREWRDADLSCTAGPRIVLEKTIVDFPEEGRYNGISISQSRPRARELKTHSSSPVERKDNIRATPMPQSPQSWQTGKDDGTSSRSTAISISAVGPISDRGKNPQDCPSPGLERSPFYRRDDPFMSSVVELVSGEKCSKPFSAIFAMEVEQQVFSMGAWRSTKSRAG